MDRLRRGSNQKGPSVSYCTHLCGCIEIKGVPEADAEALRVALELVTGDINGEADIAGNPLAVRLLSLDTPWRRAEAFDREAKEDVRLRDYAIDHDGDSAWIRGVAWESGSRDHVLCQLNWILAWIKAEHPHAAFAGRVEVWDGEGGCEPPEWLEAEGEAVKAYRTRIVKVA